MGSVSPGPVPDLFERFNSNRTTSQISVFSTSDNSNIHCTVIHTISNLPSYP